MSRMSTSNKMARLHQLYSLEANYKSQPGDQNCGCWDTPTWSLGVSWVPTTTTPKHHCLRLAQNVLKCSNFNVRLRTFRGQCPRLHFGQGLQHLSADATPNPITLKPPGFALEVCMGMGILGGTETIIPAHLYFASAQNKRDNNDDSLNWRRRRRRRISQSYD